MRTLASPTNPYADLARDIEQLLAWQDAPLPWMEANLWLRTKERTLAPFLLNAVQREYYRQRTNRDLILKARQLGFTTLICGLFFADTLLRPNTVSVIVAHDADSSQRIFQIVHLFQQRLPDQEQQEIGRPHILNRREIFWPKLNSRIYVGTAGSLTFGRAQTINNLLCSEFAFWPKPQEALAALTEAVTPEGRIVIESTANGMGNALHELWIEAKAGDNSYRPCFFPWWWDPQYRLAGPPLGELTEEEQQLSQGRGLDEDQLRWRRAKLRQLRARFPQEYPEDDISCFLASGRGRFNAAVLARIQSRIAAEPAPESVAMIHLPEGGSLPLGRAQLLIWREPEPGLHYVIGADIGEGLAHGDPSAACVLCEESGEQMAELHGRVPPAQFARLLGALGHYYWEALLGVERNNHGHSVLNTLLNEVQYTNVYRHIDYHDPYSYGQLPGWPTNAKTKPVMIDDLDEAISEGHLRTRSAELVRECLTYVVDDTGATEAQPGHHDDRVIAAAIAWQLRKRPRPQLRIAKAGPREDDRTSRSRKRIVFRVVKDGPDRGCILGGTQPLTWKGRPVRFR